MTFANPLPWWALGPVVCAAAALAWLTYRRMEASAVRRTALSLLRFVTLLAIVLFLMRPVTHVVDASKRDAVVAVLVDTSRSMGIHDMGETRLEAAQRLVTERLLPGLAGRFRLETLGFGDAVEATPVDQLSATARRSDLQAAFGALRERYRGQVLAGVVLVSDGGDTSGAAERAAADAGVAVYPIGVGAATVPGDQEVLSLTAAEAVLDDARVDIGVVAVSHRGEQTPVELRLLENGRAIEVARVTPSTPDSPVRHLFRVSPPPGAPTVYTVEIPTAAGDPVPENNARRVLVPAPSRPRRILLVEGAPGFEHGFLMRALSGDHGLEVDASIRKGQDERGANTYYVQAAQSRAEALGSGFPQTAAALAAYDAIVLANVDATMLSPAQLEAARRFVSERGGGLLVLGATSFAREGLLGSALEDALPLQLRGRDGGAVAASSGAGVNRVTLTGEGAVHPVMQIADDPEGSRTRWAKVPPLAMVAQVGGPRAGASVLALAESAGGTARALTAVQRYGRGRTMIFTGEASWRWRMHLPSSDHTYETFWRQAVRWLALPAGDPVQLALPPDASPGDTLPIRVLVRSASFEPIVDADVEVRISAPDGRMEAVKAGPAGGVPTSVVEATFRPAAAGVYRITAEARRGGAVIGVTTGSLLVGGADVEMADPRLNVPLLQRVALASGGRVIADTEVPALADSLRSRLPAAALAATQDLWNTGWSFAAIVLVLTAEWILRRQWGLR
ncbi:MAG: glutamine amidotransferase [Vicinamibacterales bacterium]